MVGTTVGISVLADGLKEVLDEGVGLNVGYEMNGMNNS